MNKIKKKLGISLVTLLITVFMLLGSTYAWFTDSVSNTGNRIQAGTLDVDLLMDKTLDGNYVSIDKGTGDIFLEADNANNSSYTLWEPGKTQIVYLAVQNKGNLAVKYQFYLDVTDYGLCDDGSGNSALEYIVVPGATKANYPLTGDYTTIENATASYPLINKGNVMPGRTVMSNEGVLDEIVKGTPNETEYFALIVHMKEEAGNVYQNGHCSIDVHLEATQYTSENDGFGTNTYDAQAEYAEKVPVSINNASKKVETDKETTLDTSNISVTVPANASVIIKKDTGNETVTISENDKLDLEIEESEDEHNITVDLGNSLKNYEVTLTLTHTQGSTSTTNEVVGIVEGIYECEAKIGVVDLKDFYHNGVAMTRVNSRSELNENGQYYYDVNLGIVYFLTNSFSPFAAQFKYNGGLGTDKYPYIINEQRTWLALSFFCSEDSDFSETDGTYFSIENNLDVSNVNTRANIRYFAGNIDFNNHEFTGLTSTNAPEGDVEDDGITAIFSRVSKTVSISNLKFLTTKITNGSHTVAAQVTGRNTGNVNITYKNVDTYGSVTGTNINNNGLLISYVYNGEADITMIDCDNYANLIGTGYKSAFLGNMGYGTVKTITATNCHNHGTIVSKNAEASMFVSNPGYFSHSIVVTLENCSNKGNILQNTTVNRFNLFTTRNDSQYKYIVNGNDMSLMTDDAFNTNIATQLGGNLVQILETTTINTSGGKFVLPQTEDATRYEIAFSFEAGGVAFGGGAGYTLQLTPTELSNANIYVYDWINLADATSEVVAHNEYGTTYYTSGNHYVYNRENSTIRDNVFVTFTAFDENDSIKSMSTYLYGK